MYNGTQIYPELGGFVPDNASIINALSGNNPTFSGQNPKTQALLSAISGEPAKPDPAPDPGGWPVLDAMSGYGNMEPTTAPMQRSPWGMLTPEQGRAEVAEGMPGLTKSVDVKRGQLAEAQARPSEAPALSFMGTPLISAQEAKESAEKDLAEAQAKKAHAEAQLAGEAALPTTTPLRNAAESAFQSAGSSYASVPKFAGYIGGWLANEAGADIHPTDNAVFRLGDEADKWAKTAFPGDPARQDELGSKAAHLTGFLSTLYGAGGVKAMTEGGPELAAKIGDAVTKASQASLASGTGAMGQFEPATAAMEAGKEQHPLAGVTITPQGLPVSERDRAMATLLGAGVGLTSLIPMASTLATAGERESGAILAEALKGSTVNAAQMAAFNVLNNAIAREFYDPSRSLTQGINEDIGLGAIAGAATHAVGAAAGPKRLSTPEEIRTFIDAAQRSDPDPAKAAYWRGMHDIVDTKLPQLSTSIGAESMGEAPPEPHTPAPKEEAAPAKTSLEIVKKPEQEGFTLEIPSDNPKSPIARAVVTPDPYEQGKASINNVWVRDDMRRQGIASRLYDHAEAELAKEGLKLVPSKSLKQAGFDFWKARDPAAVAHDIRSYEPEIRKWAKETYGHDANVAFREGGAQATVFNSNGRSIADLDAEGLKDQGVIPRREPVKLSEAGPYALRGKTDWREEAHARDALREGEEAGAPGSPGEEIRGPGAGDVLPREERAAPPTRPVVGTESFDLKDRNGEPLAGFVTNLPSSEKYKAGLHFTVYPEGSSVKPFESPKKKLGEPMADVKMRQHHDGTWDIGIMETRPQHERRGIMSSVLDAIEQRVGQKLGGSGLFWEPGYRLWSKRDPEAVKYHQAVEGEGYLSPAEINRMMEANRKSINDLDPIKDWEFIQDLQKENKKLQGHMDAVPPEGKTPEKLASPLALRGFYRPDLKAAREFPQDKASAQQWMAGLTKVPGVKRWLDLIGFDDWAKQQKGSISKDDVLLFMRMNDFNVKERHLGEGSEEYEKITEKLKSIKRELSKTNDSEKRWALQNDYMNANEELQKVKDKFGNYSIPGGKNYREMLIDIPDLKGKGWTSPHFRGQDVIHLRADDRTLPNGDLVFFLHELQSDLHQKGRREGYAPDIDQIMAERTAEYEKAHDEWEKRQAEWKPQGRKLTRAIDAVSGKLYRDGRWLDLSSSGNTPFMDPSSPNDVKWIFQRGDTLPPAYRPYVDVVKSLITPEEFKAYSDLAAAEKEHESHYEPTPPDREDVIAEREGRPPEAPFKGNWWSELGAKYLVQRAVADGYDAFALPRSDQIEPQVHAAPGSLKKFYDENLPKFIEKYVKGLGGKLEEVNSEDLNIHEHKKQLLKEALKRIGLQSGVSVADHTRIAMARRSLDGTGTIEQALAGLPESIRELALKAIEDQAEPKTNKIVRITNEMATKILTEGQAMALTSDRAMRMMDTSLREGKTVSVSPKAISAVHDAIAPMRHVVPEDTGIHVLSRIEPQKDGTLLATFGDEKGGKYQLIADGFSDLSGLRGLTADDGGKILIANFGPGQGAQKLAPSGAGEVGAGDPHTGVFFHEGVHSLYRRGLIPADDWSRLAQHAASLKLMDMSIGQYLSRIGEKINAGGDVPLRDIYTQVYKDLPRAEREALVEQEEPVAHMMELFHHKNFTVSQMEPIKDLLQKFVSGEYAKGEKSLEDIQNELEKGVRETYASDFPDKDVEDWATHGWWALGTGKSSYGDANILKRIREKYPDLVNKYKEAYTSSRESRLKNLLEGTEE